MEPLKNFAKIAFLALSHFGGAYFATAALFPSFALQVGLIAAMAAMLGFLFLLLTDSVDYGMPVAILYLLPIVYSAFGIPWWVLRLLGVGPPPI